MLYQLNKCINSKYNNYFTLTLKQFMDQTFLPIFEVTEVRGFFPSQHPLAVLPAEYQMLEQIMQDMPKTKKNGEPGLLCSIAEFERVLNDDLPFYSLEDVHDQRLLAALFRDFTFLASAWLLQPCDMSNLEGRGYGIGRDYIPAKIAQPLLTLSQKLNLRPYLDYACSYVLNNCKVIDETQPYCYENIEPIRTFYGSSSESAFIRIHAAVNKYGAEISRYIKQGFESIKCDDRESFNTALEHLIKTIQGINNILSHMLVDNKLSDYNQFRVYLMGTKENPSFTHGRGVLYEGSTPEIRLKIRGPSGAMDSIMPALDNFYEVTQVYPHNPLTGLLRKLRTYKPKEHIEFLEFIESQASDLKVREYVLSNKESTTLYYISLELLKHFRGTHKCFIHIYIGLMAKGTSGADIATWVNNQYETVEKLIEEWEKKIDEEYLDQTIKRLEITWRKKLAKVHSEKLLKVFCPIKKTASGFGSPLSAPLSLDNKLLCKYKIIKV